MTSPTGRATRSTRAAFAPVLAIVALALALRIVVARRAGIIESDGAYYAWLAQALLRGDTAAGLSTVWPPLYPAAIAAVAGLARLLGAAATPALFETAGRAVSVVLGVALLAPLAALARRIAGGRAAVATVLFAAVHPHLVQVSGAALTESTAAALLVAGVASWCAGRSLVAGAAFGLAALARPEAAVVAAALWLGGLVAPAPDGAPRGARWRPAFVLALALVLLPYAAFVTARTDAPSIGEKGAYNLWRAYAADYARVLPPPVHLSERVVDSPALAARLPVERVDVAGFVARAPGVLVARAAARALRLAFDSLPLAAAPVFALLALAGAFGVPWRTAWPAALPIALAVPLYAPFSTDRRFLVPLVPFVLVFAGAGAAALALRLGGARGTGGTQRSRVAFAAIVAAVALGHVAYTLAVTRGIDDAPEHRAAGEWLRAHPAAWRDAPGAAVMSRKPWVAYYAGAEYAELPAGGLADVVTRIERTGTRVLVVDARWGVPQRPALQPLLARETPGGGVLLAIERPHALRLYRVPPLE